MTKERDEPSAAEMLACLVTGGGGYSHTMASVQRSHRFPLPLFVQIENLAKMGEVPVSLVINQLIEAGLEAVKVELPSETVAKMNFIAQEQLERRFVTDRIEVKKDRKTTKPTRSRAK